MAKRPLPAVIADLRGSTTRPRETVTSGETDETTGTKSKSKKPTCPKHLSAGAGREWRRVVHLLGDLGTLDKTDADVIALYASLHAQWVECNRLVAENGMIVVSPNGYPQQSPHFTMATALAKQLRSLLVELGMTPSARTRVGISAPTPADEYENFRNGDNGG